MINISEQQIKEFVHEEFSDKPYCIGNGYWFIQAGMCLGKNLHYEYHDGRVHLHIEGPNWRGIRDYLRNHVMDSRVSHSHWGRYGCNWTLSTNPQTWEEVKDSFRTIAYIMNPHIMKFERSIKTPQVKLGNTPVSADFIKVGDCLKKNIEIPEYQRPYMWSTKNVEQLLKDIQSSQSNGKLIYLIGTVILHDDGKSFKIVDGQQRITTLILLLKQLGYKEAIPNLRYNHTDSFHNIRANNQFIHTWINENIPNTENFLNYIINSCLFVEITVKKLNEAFQMFESQNGRGKELEAYNLLKAYHIRAMASASKEIKVQCDKQWEDATMFLYKNNRKDILLQLFKEQLYRTRLWARGEAAFVFNKKRIDEFKGVTLNKDSALEFTFQNILVQQEIANQFMQNMNPSLFKIKGRFIHGDTDNINPFVNITQLIYNGKSFFEYVETYVEIYKRLFIQLESSQLADFKSFYKEHCLYNGYNWRKGDGYIREVYKSAIMMVFDRFGEVGVNNIYRDLYFCIYKHRLEKKQVRYGTMAKETILFRIIQNAKQFSDFHVIKKLAKDAKENTPRNYTVDEIETVFDEKEKKQ